MLTPGVRSARSAAHDQKRIATPSEAIRNGADHIIVGRFRPARRSTRDPRRPVGLTAPPSGPGPTASPPAAAIRALPQAAGRLIVTPGVRPAGAAANDQKRISTPAEAIRKCADHIVVGRPIRAAPDPATAPRAILADLPF